MSPSRPTPDSKPKSRNVTPTTTTTFSVPTPVYPIPPLAAIFMTHFHDTKGQSVVHYISNDEIRLGQGTIEHTTLPSGLHLLEEDYFAFRHGTPPSNDQAGTSGAHGKGNGKGKGKSDGDGDGTWPGVALFRSREVEGGTGRGRRMVSIGCVLANPEQAHEIFELKPWLDELYDFLEFSPPMEGAMESLSNPGPSFKSKSREGSVGDGNDSGEVDDRLIKILEGLWGSYGCKNPPSIWRDGLGGDEEGKRRAEDGLRSLAGGLGVSEQHPIKYLPRLVELLGPSIITVYKAAISGRKILIYAPPPLFPISAFGYLIAALSLPPSSVKREMTQWVGQVGLMDLTALYARQGAWVASTSDKILLSHTKLYDLSIDLSACNPLSGLGSDHDSLQDRSAEIPVPTRKIAQATIHYTTPTSSTPILANYSFSDIPLYKLISTTSTNTADWWLTFYDLFDKVYTICAGVCEYAVGKGQIGSISLPDDPLDFRQGGDDGENEPLLQHEDENGQVGGKEMRRGQGQLILRQFYHHSFHLHALLEAVVVPGSTITMGQVRELTGKWLVTKEDYKFWSDLARYWENPIESGDGREGDT